MRLYCKLLDKMQCSAFVIEASPTDTCYTVRSRFLSNPSLSTSIALTDHSQDPDEWALLLEGRILLDQSTLLE